MNGSRWSFSLVLLVGYLMVFHLWAGLSPTGVVVATLVALGGLGSLYARAWRRGYFVNRWDAFWHGSVLLDVALEGLIVPLHSGYSFYLCAAAFIVVVGGYRGWHLRATSPAGAR